MRGNGVYNRGLGRSFADEGTGAEPAELDGLRVIFDQKVGLHPANLQKSVGQPAPKAMPRAAAMTWGRYGRR